MDQKYILHAYELPPYTPPAHSLTVNRRLLGRREWGSQRVEVVLGEIEYGGQADPHRHSGVEQAFYVIEGEATVDIEGESSIVGPDDFVYLPAGATHRVTPLPGKKLKILIIYAPPLEAEEKTGMR